MQDILNSVAPYLTAFSVILGVGTLGFIINLANLIRTAAQSQVEIVQKQLDSVRDDLVRTEKWAEREKTELREKNNALTEELKSALDNAGLSLADLASGQSLDKVTDSIRAHIDELVSKMETASRLDHPNDDPEWHLQIAKGYMAQKMWREAASHLDSYVTYFPLNHEAQYTRGVAHANVRGGDDENLSALRAYSEAIASAPEGLDRNLFGRYLTYRGAMLKRMNRLEEAKSDLLLAQNFISRRYEIVDNAYNLASVYSMLADKENLLAVIRKHREDGEFTKLVRYRLKSYFSPFKDDRDFLALLS